jgi:hypothetical protein
MEKKEVIMQIRSAGKNELTLEAKEKWIMDFLKPLLEFCVEKKSSYVKCVFSVPYKSRTTGKGSQNNKIWKMITEIAQETGNDIDDVEEYAKERAMVRGYPYKINKMNGKPMPLSMTKINTVEASALIETLQQLAAELGIVLHDGD